MERRHLLAAGLAGVAGLGLATTPRIANADPRGSRHARLRWHSHPIALASDPYLSSTHLADIDSTAAGTWAVGAHLLDGFQVTRPLALRRRGARFVETPMPVDDGTLYSVAVVSPTEVWAVGAVGGHDSTPLVVRWNGSRWLLVDPPQVPAGAFDDVTLGPDGTVWITGWARIGAREHAVVYRRTTTGWALLATGLEEMVNGNALVVGARDMWLATNPGMALSDGGGWTADPSVPGDGSHIMTGLAGSDRDLWGAGVYHGLSGERPLVMRHRGSTWSRVPAPDRNAQLADVAVWGDRVIAVGEKFSTDWTQFHPYVLEHTRAGFRETTAPVSTVAPPSAYGGLNSLAVHGDRLWAVGTVGEFALIASVG